MKVHASFQIGGKEIMTNYRLISVLTVLFKTNEKSVLARLLEYLENSKLLYAGQYGFRRSCDTELAIIDVVTSFQLDLNSNKQCGLLSQDLRNRIYCIELG